MNLGGIKVSSIEIERVCNGVDGRVLETSATDNAFERKGVMYFKMVVHREIPIL